MRTGPIVVAFAMFLSAGVSAYAGSVTFDFNSLSSGASSATIQTYMDGVLGCTACVTVTGAVADKTYNGEGYVVGPGGKSLTLGTSNGATSNSSQTPSSSYDTFIANTNDSSSQISNEITLKFSGFTINGTVSFDYEIFPDGSCTSLNSANCGGSPTGGIYPNQPDFEFEAGTNSTGSDPAVNSFATNGTQYGVTPSATGSDGISTKGPNGTISAPQYIGAWTGTLTNINELDFIDRPATIGIDNLTISYNGNTPFSSTPEPASIALLGTLVVLLTKKLRRV